MLAVHNVPYSFNEHIASFLDIIAIPSQNPYFSLFFTGGVLLFLFSFISAVGIGYVFIPYLKKKQVIEKKEQKQTMYGTVAEEFEKLHQGEGSKTPRFGGILVCVPFILTLFILYLVSPTADVLIALIVAIIGCMVGTYADYGDVTQKAVSKKIRITISALVGAGVGGVFFALVPTHYAIALIPTLVPIPLGWGIILFTSFWFIVWYTTTVIDGIDGLAGSIYVVIALVLGLMLLSTSILSTALFSLAGGILGFLLYNKKPAKIYLSESGTMPILFFFSYTALFVQTGGSAGSETVHTIPIWFFIIVGGVLLATIASNVLQLTYRKLYKKKLFKIAPIHHHFEAIGISQKNILRIYVITTLIASCGAVVLSTL